MVCMCMCFAGASCACAMNLDGVKEHFLKNEWKDGIREGEGLLASASRDSSDLDQLYYYLGLCYFKDGQYLRSADIFEIILKEFPKSALAAQARKALGEAQARMPTEPRPRVLTESQARMPAESALEPSEPDIVLAKDLLRGTTGPVSTGTSFWVQIGAFSSSRNAENLESKLSSAGYSTSVMRALAEGRSIYKVRVGPFYSREDARAAAKKLGRQGHPTKIIPY
jgi:hypothetical protein